MADDTGAYAVEHQPQPFRTPPHAVPREQDAGAARPRDASLSGVSRAGGADVTRQRAVPAGLLLGAQSGFAGDARAIVQAIENGERLSIPAEQWDQLEQSFAVLRKYVGSKAACAAPQAAV